MTFLSNAQRNMRKYFKSSNVKIMKKISKLYQTQNIRFIFTRIVFSICTGSVVVKDFPNGKRKVPFNSRVILKPQQKMSSLPRENFGVILTLQTFEHFPMGSTYLIEIFFDHKPLLYSWAGKEDCLTDSSVTK